jgi:hypothetical protein
MGPRPAAGESWIPPCTGARIQLDEAAACHRLEFLGREFLAAGKGRRFNEGCHMVP